MDELIDFDNWVDMRVGETGTMIAKYQGPFLLTDGREGVKVSNAEWQDMLLDAFKIACDHRRGKWMPPDLLHRALGLDITP